MLTIIEPKDHGAYQTQIDSFLNLLNIYQNYSPSPKVWEQGTFIIASDDEYGVYGGVLLLEKSIRNLEIKIKELVSTFQPETRGVWTGLIGFYRGHDRPYSEFKILQGYLDFYENLLKALNDFGIEQEIDFLCLTLNPIEHIKVQKYGHWNYICKVLPDESLDSLFHGILPISRRDK